MSNTSNPRLQCKKCGKWRRLWDRFGNQLIFPFNTGEFKSKEEMPVPTDDVWEDLCVWCHAEYGIILPPLSGGQL